MKLLHQLKSGFKRTTEKNKDHSKVLIEEDYLIDPIFWRLNRLSILWFETTMIEQHTQNIFLQLIKDCPVMVNGQNLFDESINNCQRTYGIKKLQLVREMIMQFVVF